MMTICDRMFHTCVLQGNRSTPFRIVLQGANTYLVGGEAPKHIRIYVADRDPF